MCEEGCTLVNNDDTFKLRDGQPNDAYLLSDGVHLSYAGTNRLVKNLGLTTKEGKTDVAKWKRKVPITTLRHDRPSDTRRFNHGSPPHQLRSQYQDRRQQRSEATTENMRHPRATTDQRDTRLPRMAAANSKRSHTTYRQSNTRDVFCRFCGESGQKRRLHKMPHVPSIRSQESNVQHRR